MKNRIARKHEVIVLGIGNVCISQRAMSMNDFEFEMTRIETRVRFFEQISPLATATTIIVLFTMVACRHRVIYPIHYIFRW